MRQFEYVTTDAIVAVLEAAEGVFRSLLSEIRELSKKKPEATLSAGKVKIINRVLHDLLGVLKEEPEGKYLDQLDDEALPQVSDALLIMVQFEAAVNAFRGRYNQYVYGHSYWITEEILDEWETADQADQDEESAEG